MRQYSAVSVVPKWQLPCSDGRTCSIARSILSVKPCLTTGIQTQKVMMTSPQQNSRNGGEKSQFSLAASRANLSVMPGSDAARQMTATSGRRCTDALTRCDQIGSLLKTLLASSRWSSRARYLRWNVKPLYSTKVTAFEDTNSERPSPFNASAKTLKVTDMMSSQFLFQLAVSEPLTAETECSSSDIAERMRRMLLPTPLVVEREHPERVVALKATGAIQINSRANGEQRPNGIIDFLQFFDLLPTPNTGCYRNAGNSTDFWENRKGKNRQMDICMWVYDAMKDEPAAKDGKYFRLNPLFTEEMMGFPLMWTALPFLSVSGEPNHSKPTETQ